MYHYDRRHWLQHFFHVGGSVAPAITPRVIVILLAGAGIVLLNEQQLLYPVPLGVHGLWGGVLGLILAFRTNTGYDRYWEGRKAWGAVVNRCRNLALMAKATADNGLVDVKDGRFLNACARVFPFAMRADLLHEKNDEQELVRVETTLSLGDDDKDTFKLAADKSLPQQVLLSLESRVQRLHKDGAIDSVDHARFTDDGKVLIDSLGVCHRIQKTPIPFAYSVYLRRVLLLYLATLSIPLAPTLHWNTLWVVALVSYTLLGLEQIGVEIENPFEEGENDLDLKGISQAIEKDVTSFCP
mgnify:CR=1 FL=1